MDDKAINSRLDDLERHLKQENPVLLQVVRSFRELDRVGQRMGVLSRADSYALQIPWWPLIAVLGTFSSGKSTFINDYVGSPLQKTGNQAVDDKFTVICFSRDEDGRVLPGLALDADVRFPFYRVSDEIERVAAGEGQRVDAYLQLKTSSSSVIKGKILIDSPGFDADAQRTSTLRITRHIIDLSDLVLVMFDARHPEPGAMHDTLDHLVGETIGRPDSNKFLYVLNQIDTAAREDNPEEVIAAWQRALSHKGLTAGRFYCIYNEAAAVPIEDPATRDRFRTKRDADLRDIRERIRQVEVERAYRIVGALEHTATRLEHEVVPTLQSLRESWRRRVRWGDASVLVLLLAAGLGAAVMGDYFTESGASESAFRTAINENAFVAGGLVGAMVLLLGVLHFTIRNAVAKRMVTNLYKREEDAYAIALRRNTRFWRSMFGSHPVGWGRRPREVVAGVRHAASKYVQTLNDQFTDPSGERGKRDVGATPVVPENSRTPIKPPIAPSDVALRQPQETE